MLGYINQKEAEKKGFTHEGTYFGISLWITNSHTNRPVIKAKWAPMEYAISFFSQSERLIKDKFFPNKKHRHHVDNVSAIGSSIKK